MVPELREHRTLHSGRRWRPPAAPARPLRAAAWASPVDGAAPRGLGARSLRSAWRQGSCVRRGSPEPPPAVALAYDRSAFNPRLLRSRGAPRGASVHCGFDLRFPRDE